MASIPSASSTSPVSGWAAPEDAALLAHADMETGRELHPRRPGLKPAAARPRELGDCVAGHRTSEGVSRDEARAEGPRLLSVPPFDFVVEAHSARLGIFGKRITRAAPACGIPDENASLDERQNVAQRCVLRALRELCVFRCGEFALDAVE